MRLNFSRLLALFIPGFNPNLYNLIAVPSNITPVKRMAVNATLPNGSYEIKPAIQTITVDDPYLFGSWPLIRGIPAEKPRVSFYNLVVVGNGPKVPAIEAVGSTIRRARPTAAYMTQFFKAVTPESLDSPGSRSLAAGASYTFQLGVGNPADDVRPAHWINIEVQVPALNMDDSEVAFTLTVVGTIQTLTGNEKGVFSYGPTPLRVAKGAKVRLALFAVVDADDGERQPLVFRGDTADPVVVTIANPAGSNTAQVRAFGSSTNDTEILDMANKCLESTVTVE